MAWSPISSSSSESGGSFEDDIPFSDREERSLRPEQVAYSTGAIIVTCRPYIHTVTTSFKGKFCDRCLKVATDSQRFYQCRECGQIYYCKLCQQSLAPSIFKTVHNLECSLLFKYSDILSDSTKLFLRLYLRLKNPESIHFQVYLDPLTGHEITFESLIPNLNMVMENSDDLSEQILRCHQRYLTKDIDSDKPLDDLDRAILLFIALLDELRLCDELSELTADDDSVYQLWTIFIRLWSHAIPIYDETVTGLFSREAIAYGLYLEPSTIVKHSCEPNCAFAHYGSVLQLRAMTTIGKDDQLTVSLADLSAPKEERHKELKNYYLDCDCRRCTQLVDPVDYQRFRSVRDEFVSAFNQELVSTGGKSLSFMNFTASFHYNEEDIREMYEKCCQLHSMAHRLSQYYGLIYENYHPDITRFMFAYTAIKTNRLLFRLGLKKMEDVSSEPELGNESKRDSTGSVTSMDHYVAALQNWSMWIKTMVQMLRWTHGLDHKLFRVMPVPLMEVWHQANSKRPLTMIQFYPDTGILLQIYSSSPLVRPNVLEWLKAEFNNLISGQKDTNNHENFLSSKIKFFFYFLLVTVALLFPLFIYFTLYVQDHY